MFLVTLKDGTQIRETLDVDGWNLSDEEKKENPDLREIPIDTEIASVSLLDFGSLATTVSGYDYYVVAYSAEAACPTNPDGVARRPTVTAQVLYAIRDLSREKPLIQKEFEVVLKEITVITKGQEQVGNLLRLDIARKVQIEIERRFKSLLAKMTNAEVLEVSFGFQYKTYPRSELRQGGAGLRKGVERPPSKTALDGVRGYLLEPAKEGEG